MTLEIPSGNPIASQSVRKGVKIRRLLRSRLGLVLALTADFLLWGGPHRPHAAFQPDLNAAFAGRGLAHKIFLKQIIKKRLRPVLGVFRRKS